MTFYPGKCGDRERGRAWERDLTIDLDVIEAWGAKAVLTLIEPHEMVMLGVPDLGERIVERGNTWHALPIVDVTTPGEAFKQRWSEAGPATCQLLQAGGNVLVHCRGGRGRAGMVAALMAIELGVSTGDAIRRVRERGGVRSRRWRRSAMSRATRRRFDLQGSACARLRLQ